MSKLVNSGRRSLALIVLLLCASRSTRAQDLAQLGARVISADHAVDAAHDSVNRLIEEMKKLAVPPDSLRVGGITLRFNATKISSSTLALVQHAMNESWSEVQRGLGDAALGVAQREPLILRQHEASNRLELNVLSFELNGRPGAGRAFRSPISISEARTGIVEAIGSLAAIAEPATLDVYAGPWIPASPITAKEWGEAAIDLATTTSAATRDCYAGSVSRCESALGLTEVKDPLTEWYSPADWRILVMRFPIPIDDPPERRARREACEGGNAPDLCETFARERPVPRPLITDTRRTLIGLALELGGAHAYDRMMAARGSALDILASASELHADDLVAAWRLRVLTATPPRVSPEAREVTSMIAWTMLFAAVAFRKRP